MEADVVPDAVEWGVGGHCFPISLHQAFRG